MANARLSEQDWRIRLAVYCYFVANERPPTASEIAQELDIAAEEARQSYRRLHEHHALFLEPGAEAIRMANPLSAVATPYRVHVNGRHLWANCAWDSLGIPAMLHEDARIEAACAFSGATASYAITQGRLIAHGGVVHFPLPFRRWYDDLIHT
jgi:hypothetical protein